MLAVSRAVLYTASYPVSLAALTLLPITQVGLFGRDDDHWPCHFNEHKYFHLQNAWLVWLQRQNNDHCWDDDIRHNHQYHDVRDTRLVRL